MAASAAGLLDRMEKDGLVARTHKDRRTNLLTLTDRGSTLYRAGLAVTEAYKSQALDGITDGQMETFKAVLDRMLKNVRQQ